MSEDNSVVDENQNAAGWKTAQVYTLSAICLLLGLALGYLFRGSQAKSPAVATSPQVAAAQPPTGQPSTAQPSAMPASMPTLDQMKQMADTKAAPLLEKLRNDPNDAALLVQVGRIYESTHQFKDAATYFGKALEVNPKDVPTRTEMASCMYYDGDLDGAIAQLQQALQDQPKDANVLFNLGMIKWKDKSDAAGAVAYWHELLKSNPKLEPAKKALVQKLIAEASRPAKAN
jgi:cytochrome c-type biogenesis protein CcmH/NrfG